jgi:hypothetical protein
MAPTAKKTEERPVRIASDSDAMAAFARVVEENTELLKDLASR